MEKILAMQVAAQLTQAACSGVGSTNLPVDPELKDQTVRAKNLMVWETFRVFYHATVKAMADSTWPNPEFRAGNFLPNLLQSAIPLLQAVLPELMKGDVGEVVKKLLALLPSPTPLPQGPLPNPGEPAK